MSEKTVKQCGSCGGTMTFLGEKQIQMGEAGLVFGHLSNLLAGALDVELWECPDCGKLDFYRQGSTKQERNPMAQTICPKCGTHHNLNAPQCPCCGLKYSNHA